jgi:hypothetical protein
MGVSNLAGVLGALWWTGEKLLPEARAGVMRLLLTACASYTAQCAGAGTR